MKLNPVTLRRAMAVLPAALVATVLGGCEQEPVAKPVQPRLVNAIRVADTSGLSERTFPGRARAGQEVNLSFRVAGPLITLPVSVGDEVEAGAIIARIDPADYESTVGSVEGQVAREDARAKRAAADLQRLQNVMKEDPGATSQAAIDRAQQLRDSARASARSLRASLTTARNQLGYTELKAPFGGVVVETYVENFETVVAKQPIARLLNPASIEFVINVPESLIGQAPNVETIEVSFDALEGVKVPATIKEIGKEASQATRTYPVTLVMSQPEGVEILPGMAGQARVSARPADAASAGGLEVPATALFTGTDSSKSYVWVIDEAGKTLSRREVEVGPLSRFGVRITSGLAAGEWVVIKGVHSVQDGEAVRILDAAKGSAAS